MIAAIPQTANLGIYASLPARNLVNGQERKRIRMIWEDTGAGKCFRRYHPDTHGLIFKSTGLNGMTGNSSPIMGRSRRPDRLYRKTHGCDKICFVSGAP
jgi:hypothetical protein